MPAKSNAMQKSKDLYIQAREVMFRPVEVKSNGVIKTEPWVSAYCAQINAEAMKGDIHAIQEQHWLINRLEKRGQLVEAPRQSELTAIERREQQHENLVKALLTINLGVTERIRPQVVAYLEAKYGSLSESANVIPDIFSEEIYNLHWSTVDQASKLFRPKDPNVGYGRPPVRHRIPKGRSGNPAGRPRRRDDAWTPFRDGLAKIVPITIGGVKVPKPSFYVACLQLCQHATKGDRFARRLVRDMVVLLDDRGLMEPPKKRRRRSHAKVSSAQWKEALDALTATIKTLLPDVEASLTRTILQHAGIDTSADDQSSLTAR